MSTLRVSRELLDDILLETAPERAALLGAIIAAAYEDLSSKGEVAIPAIRKLIASHVTEQEDGQ